MSENLVNLIVKVLSWSIMGISVIISALFFIGYFNEAPFILWAYLLTGFAAALAVVFPIIFMFVYPKKALKTLGGVALIGLVFVVGYFMADSTPIASLGATQNLDFSNTSVLIFTDTGLIATYFLAGVAVIALLLTGIRSIFTR